MTCCNIGRKITTVTLLMVGSRSFGMPWLFIFAACDIKLVDICVWQSQYMTKAMLTVR